MSTDEKREKGLKKSTPYALYPVDKQFVRDMARTAETGTDVNISDSSIIEAMIDLVRSDPKLMKRVIAIAQEKKAGSD